jgi:hypothetical protein
MTEDLQTLADIQEDEANANLGTERGAFALQESLVRYGPARSIVVDRKGKLIAGEKTARTAKELGLPAEWNAVAASDARGRVLAELREARRLAWAKGDYNAVYRGLQQEAQLSGLNLEPRSPERPRDFVAVSQNDQAYLLS